MEYDIDNNNHTYPYSTVVPPLHSTRYSAVEKDGYYNGLTKREHFAALALQGLLSNSALVDKHDMGYLSVLAVAQADTLIAALNARR